MNKKLFFIFLFGIFLISLASAAVDYSADTQTYNIDSIWPTWLGGNGESIVTLVDNTDYCLIDCSSTILFNNEEELNLLDGINFLDKKGNDVSDDIKDLEFLLGKYENVTKTNYSSPIYSNVETCEEINLTNSTEIQNCYYEILGYENYTEEDLVWTTYDGSSQSGISYLKINAKKNLKKDIDWIITFRGKELSEWAWWDTDWNFKRLINISENSGSTLNNYSMLIYVPYDSDMSSNFSDLRFTDSSETQELGYWIENKTDSSFAWVWVKVPTLTASSQTDIYMYYGNSGASSNSNGNNAFLFFDDFNEISLNSSKWDSAGTVTYGSGVVSVSNADTNWIKSKINLSNNEIAEFDWKFNAYSYNQMVTLVRNSNPSATPLINFQVDFPNTNQLTTRTYTSSGLSTALGTPVTANTFNRYKIERVSTTDNKFYINDLLNATHSSDISSQSHSIAMVCGESGATSTLDLVFFRKYSTVNPTYTIGPEEQQAGVTIEYVTPPTPVNYANLTDENFTIQVNVTYLDVNFTNITYSMINVNGTEFIDTFTNETYSLNYTLPTGHYHYNVTVCADSLSLGTFCDTTETRHINHDIDPPVINLTSPTGTYPYLIENYTLDLNWTVTDEGAVNDSLDSCWFNYGYYQDPVSYSSSTGTNFTYETPTNDRYLIVQTRRGIYVEEINYTYDLSSCSNYYINSTATSGGWTNVSCGATTINNFYFGTICIDGVCRSITNFYIFDGYYNKAVNCSLNTTQINYRTDINTLNFSANDTFGNTQTESTSWNYKLLELNQTYNSETTEGSSEDFQARIKLNPSYSITGVSLIYNGTSNVGTSSTSGGITTLEKTNLIIPNVDNDSNLTFYWVILLSDSSIINLSTQTQDVFNLALDACSSYSVELFNLTSLDEEMQTILSNTTHELAINIYSANREQNIINFSGEYTSNPTLICLNRNLTQTYSLDTIIRYTSAGYSNEYYNIVNFSLSNSSIPRDINLYSLNESDSTSFQLTFNGEDFLPVENALVYVERKYIKDDDFKTVELPKTDSNGQTVIHLVQNDVIYNLIVMKDGVILGNFQNLNAFCDDYTTGQCVITLNALGQESNLFDYSDAIGIYFSTTPEYNETSKDVSFSFVSIDGSTKNVTMVVSRSDIFGNTTVCTKTLISTAGELTCSVGDISDTSLKSTVYIDGEEWINGNVNIDSDGYGSMGYIAAFVISLVIILIFGNTRNGLIISIIISYVIAISCGIMIGGLVGLGTAGIWALVLFGVAMYLNNKNR